MEISIEKDKVVLVKLMMISFPVKEPCKSWSVPVVSPDTMCLRRTHLIFPLQSNQYFILLCQGVGSETRHLKQVYSSIG